MDERLEGWVLDSEDALRVGRGVCLAAAYGVVVTATLLLSNLIRDEKIIGLVAPWLVFLAVPILVAGQLWAIAVLVARGKRGADVSRSAPVDNFFEGLPRWQIAAVIALFSLGFWAAVTALGHLSSTGPASPDAAGAARQRLVAAVFLGFFVVHFGVASAELRRRRSRSAGAEMESVQT